jgi:Integrase core domain
MVARLVAPEHDPAGEESSLPVDQNRIIGRTPSTRADNRLEFQWFRRFWTMKSGVENCQCQRPCGTVPRRARSSSAAIFISGPTTTPSCWGWLRRPSGLPAWQADGLQVGYAALRDIESFNGKFRMEHLNTHWFMSLDDARSKMEAWRKDYNEVRPHSAIGNKPPISLVFGSPALPPA